MWSRIQATCQQQQQGDVELRPSASILNHMTTCLNTWLASLILLAKGLKTKVCRYFLQMQSHISSSSSPIVSTSKLRSSNVNWECCGGVQNIVQNSEDSAATSSWSPLLARISPSKPSVGGGKNINMCSCILNILSQWWITSRKCLNKCFTNGKFYKWFDWKQVFLTLG